MKYIQAKPFAKSFTCPHCGTIAMQTWWWKSWKNGTTPVKEAHPIRVGLCYHCERSTLWIEDKMFYPETGNAPFPNPEMPEPVLKLYNEAASIQTKSPRGAAALLRLAVQVLCKELGEEGKNVSKDIGSLVKKGLPEIVQRSLDIVRVVGNDAVHPGQIDTDNPETVARLFELINVVVEYMIALPKKISGIYEELPDDKKDGITNRDK